MPIDAPAEVSPDAPAEEYVPLTTSDFVPLGAMADVPAEDESAHDPAHDDIHRETEFPDWLHGDQVTGQPSAALSAAADGDQQALLAAGGFDANHGSANAIGAAELAGTEVDNPAVHLVRIGEELWAWLKTLTSAAVYATLIVTFGFQVARVEGQSMAPTLEDQDRLIVNKLAYRLGDPQIGDIVMLYYPKDPDKSFVKRVIGEPGDTIRIVDGRVYRNDVPLRDDFIAQEYRSHDDWGPEVVPDAQYFVMGDHRNNSSDSRAWGWVPKKYIIGKVQLRWWPINTATIFSQQMMPGK